MTDRATIDDCLERARDPALDPVDLAVELARVADAVLTAGDAERVHGHCAELPGDSVVRWLSPATDADRRAP